MMSQIAIEFATKSMIIISEGFCDKKYTISKHFVTELFE